MKKKWFAAALVTLAIAGVGTTALTDGLVKISINGEKVNEGISASEAKSVEEMVNKLGAFTQYDKRSGKFEVEKPKVNMLVIEGIQQLKSKDIVFTNPVKGYGDKDIPRTFNVFVEVDDAPVSEELKLQVELIGPNGKEVDAGKVWKYSTKRANSFYFSEPFISTKLEQYGTYKVQLKMKSDKYDEYVVVGENNFTVGR